MTTPVPCGRDFGVWTIAQRPVDFCVCRAFLLARGWRPLLRILGRTAGGMQILLCLRLPNA